MSIYAVCSAFTNAACVRYGMQKYEEHLAGMALDGRYLLDPAYPLNRQENREGLVGLCREYNWKYVDGGFDRGMCGNFNYLFSRMPLQPGDLIVGFDPDSAADQPGWQKACVEVLKICPGLGWIALRVGPTTDEIKGGQLRGALGIIAGHKVFVVNQTVGMWSLAAFRWDVIRESGGFNPHPNMPFYGGTEITLVQWAFNHGFTYGYLWDYTQTGGHSELHDKEYGMWKAAHVAGDRRGFKEWLKGVKP